MMAMLNKMSNVEKEVAEEYASSLADLTVNSKPLINMLTILAHENIMHAPVIVQAVEKHLQQVPADMKLPVLYLIDSIVKNVGDTYTSLFTQNIVSTFCSVFEKVDERTRAQMFKLRQTWNEVFPAKKLYAVDVRVHSIDPAWPITAVPPTIHVNPKFFRTQQTTTASPTASVASVTSVVAPIQPVVTPVAVTTSIKPTVIPTPALPDEDSHTLNEAKMREELLKKQKELLELQQRKLELELMQTKARLEEQQKQLEKQLRPAAPISEAVSTPLLAALQSETAKLLVTAAAAVTTKTLKNVSSSAVSKTVVTTSQTTVSEATVTTTATSPAKGSRAASANSRSKSESVTTVAAGKTSSVATVTSTSRPVPTSAVTTTAPSTRSRDPRLASRQVQQPAIVPVNNSTAQSEDEDSEEPDTVFDQVKLETSKPKPQITINLGCANKGTINKDSRGISKKDPRLLSKKVQGITSSIKGQTLSATNSGGSGKGGNKLSGRGPSPKPSSPSRTSSSSGGGGKTSASSSSSSSATSSPRKQQSKSGNNNASSKQSRNKVLPKLIQIDLTDSPPPKTETKEESISNKEKEKSESSSKTSSSSSKTETHKKKSSPSGPSRSLTSSPSSDRKKGSGKSSSESLSTGGNSLSSSNNKQERGKSPISGEKRRSRERSERDRFISKIDMFGDSDSLESPSPPPPPIISSDSKKRDESSASKNSAFKDIKQSMKARNYVRRNRPSKSRSPEIPPVAAIPPESTKDVDLRVGGPPEKHPRLNVFQPEIKVSPASAEEEMKKPLVEAVSKDVDLRQLPTSSPGKKRPSMERTEQPPQKKSKAEVYDELFGREDVDLRQMPPAVAIVKPTNLPPSPPPPPIISQPSPVPTSASSQDSSANAANSPKRVSPDREKGVEAVGEDKFAMEDDSKENSDSGLKPRGWAKYKETYKTPLRLSFSHEDAEQSEPQGPKNSPRPNSPLRERETMFGTPRSMLLRRAEKFDKLGRRLLYNRSSDDPDERQRSLNSEDTDMRQRFLDDDCGGHDINVYNIILQADEQLKNGTITSRQYNTLLTQVIQLNEVQKLREAQRKDKLEDKENWERSRRRRGPPLAMSPDIGQLSPISADEDSEEGSVPPMGAKFDIDERLLLQPRLPPTASVPSPPEPSIPPSGKFQPGPAPWSDMGHPPMVSGNNRWEHPRPWLQGAPPPLPSGPMGPGHLPPHVQPVHIVNQPPPPQGAPFHRPPGPEFRPVGNFGGMQRWGAPRFQSRELDRHFEPRLSRPDNRFRMMGPREHRRSSASGELPLADPMLLDLIEQDTMRTINIDGVPREIRFYGDTAIVMLSWDDPREIGFQSGTRRIIFDERESVVCALNDTYRDFIIDGRSHSIRLGSPTRELYIDGKWYECFFGGPPINIEIGGKIHSVQLEGPPPPVKIGFMKRTDLVAGKINLIINAMTMVPIFLDAKPQRFDIEEKPHVLRFVDALTTVLINGQPMKVEFGGLPKPIVVRGKKHFIRFSVLPDGIKPGYVKIINMEGRRLSSPPRKENENSNSGFAAGDEDSNDAKFQIGHDPVLPVLGNASRAGRGLRRTFGSEKGRDSPQESEHASGGSPGHFHTDNAVMGPVVPVHQPRPKQLGPMPLEMLTSLMPTVMAPASGCSYQVEQDSQDGQQKPPALQQQAPAQTPVGVSEPSVPTTSATVGIPFLPVEINVDELFQKLVATGIVPTSEKAEVDSKKEEEVRSIKHVDFKQPDTLKVRQPGVVAILYSGIQCSSCGVRFPPEQTMKYSQHLDWHFRQNRRDRDNTRKAQSRKWYYDVSDWIQFEEIEDLEERAQSWFETQQATGEEEKEIQEVPSVCAGENPEDTFCDVCHDKFEQFYNEEREEWHLRAAVRVDGKTYHPLCYEDYKASLEEPSVTEEHKEDDAEKKKEGEDDGKKDEVESEVKEEEGVKEEKTEEAMDTSEPVEVKTEVVEEETKTEEKDAAKVENMEEDSKEIKEEPTTDVVMKEEPAESEQKPDTESQVKTESEEKEAEESMVEDDLQPMPTAVDTTTTAVASSIDGNVQFEESSQIGQTGPISGKIKINISKSLATASKDTQEEGDADMSTAVQSNDNESGPIATETSRESGEEGVCQEVVNSGEPPPPGVEPIQLKPRLVGRKLTELPPVMKGTELSGLCSIM